MNLPAILSGRGGGPVRLRVRAAGAADHRGVLAAPATVVLRLDGGWSPLVREGVEALRGAGEVTLVPPGEESRFPVDATLDLPGHLLLPGLVNAHTHLDLTGLGTLEEARGDFPRFIRHVREGRPGEAGAIAAAVAQGVELSLRGGVVAVGDIAGCPAGGPDPAACRALAASGLGGVSFLEFFAIGDRAARGVERAVAVLDGASAGGVREGGVRVGLQPHAPYSVEPDAYRAALARAAERGWPVATHLAESPAEREFIARGTGPHRGLLEGLGLWSERLGREFGRGETPIAHASAFLEGPAGSRCLLVHCNDVSDADLALLAARRAVVAYCPRSSEYFEAERHFGPHRYRELLAAGVRVCLGTDSVLNLPAGEVRAGGISVLDEARLLGRRDGVGAAALLAMMTVHGAAALGLEASAFEFGGVGTPRRMRGLTAVACGNSGQMTPLESAVYHGGPARLLFLAGG